MPTNEMITQLQREIESERQRLQAKEHALALLKGEAVLVASEGGSLPQDFAGLRITEGARRLIAEAHEPLDTPTIAELLQKRGLKTTSKNFVATVYATLANSTAFKREDGKWSYVGD